METRSCIVIFLLLIPVVLGAWRTSMEDRTVAREPRRIHYHSKRHMLPEKQEVKKKRSTPMPKVREIRKKPSGHLAALEDDDMDNDEVVSVAIGPPPIRPKFEKVNWKGHPPKRSNATKTNNNNNINNNNAVDFVRDVLTQLGREFLLNQVNENFVFGQYVGNSMKNLTGEVRLRMQHEILDIIVKYQKINRGEIISDTNNTDTNAGKRKDDEKVVQPKENKIDKKLNLNPNNDTEDGWPDFSNLAKIVG